LRPKSAKIRPYAFRSSSAYLHCFNLSYTTEFSTREREDSSPHPHRLKNLFMFQCDMFSSRVIR
jgi:hypothetical protein